MARWYRINRWGRRPLDAVEVVKETAQQVVYLELWAGKKSERRAYKDGEFFKTFDDAKAYLVSQAERSLERANDARSQAIQRLKDVQKLTESEVPDVYA